MGLLDSVLSQSNYGRVRNDLSSKRRHYSFALAIH